MSCGKVNMYCWIELQMLGVSKLAFEKAHAEHQTLTTSPWLPATRSQTRCWSFPAACSQTPAMLHWHCGRNLQPCIDTSPDQPCPTAPAERQHRKLLLKYYKHKLQGIQLAQSITHWKNSKSAWYAQSFDKDKNIILLSEHARNAKTTTSHCRLQQAIETKK